MKVLITGHTGFLGKNLFDFLLHNYGDNIVIEGFNSKNNREDLERLVDDCDFIYDFAAVHRPKNDDDFMNINYGVLRDICNAVEEKHIKCGILYTSSIQAEEDTPYGNSKKESEELLINHAKISGCNAYIYRLTNLFGPGARPNSHSVVATFCYNLARGIPIKIDDADHQMRLCYVNDVVELIAGHLADGGGD